MITPFPMSYFRLDSLNLATLTNIFHVYSEPMIGCETLPNYPNKNAAILGKP